MREIKLKKQKKSYDKIFLGLVVIFTFLGVVLVLNASAPEAISIFSDRFYFAKQQLFWGVLGIALMLVISRINYNFWEKIAVLVFLMTLILLVLVLIPPFGHTTLGAKRWISLGPIKFQPSEFIKLTLTLYIAKVASKDKKIWSYLLPLGITVILIMIQPDLGTSLVISLITFAQIFIAGVSFIQLVTILLSGGLVGFLLIITSSYRRERLLSFVDPFKDTLGKSYHIRQILYALGSGGILGVGLGQSRQKFLFLPEAATDSIFAVISEELGFIGASFFILLYIFLLMRCLKIAKNAPDKFSKIMAIGITAWLSGQTLINLSSMVSLTPLTGVPLPFISYGGSSLISMLAGCGILLNISRYAGKE